MPERAQDGAKLYVVAANRRVAGKGGMAWDLIQRLVLGDVGGGVTHLADCDILVVR